MQQLANRATIDQSRTLTACGVGVFTSLHFTICGDTCILSCIIAEVCLIGWPNPDFKNAVVCPRLMEWLDASQL